MLSPASSVRRAELHRMLELLNAPPGTLQPLTLGELSIDFAGHEVRVRGAKVQLTHREFALLGFLVNHRGRVCRREELVAQIWADRRLSSDRTVDIHVYRLRTKLADMPHLIETIRNVGYVIRVEESRRA